MYVCMCTCRCVFMYVSVFVCVCIYARERANVCIVSYVECVLVYVCLVVYSYYFLY